MDVEPAAWNRPPYLMRWHADQVLPSRRVREHRSRESAHVPPWIDTGPTDAPFDITQAIAALCADICRHSPELAHINTEQILFGFLQARNSRRHGLQARVTPLRFPGGELVRTARGRLYQVQRFNVDDTEILYLMTFCLPRFMNQSFDEKFITIFHELHHIGPKFDGDLRRHRGRYSLHTHSKSAYDARMSAHARAYLAEGANPRLHGFLRLNFAQLQARHGRVVGTVLPRARILEVKPGEVSP